MAFSTSVAQARFAEGDILYDRITAYNCDWGKASESVGHMIQVRYPARANDGSDQNGREVFARNWTTEVRADLYFRLNKVTPGQIRTTQGRLYTTLWKGQIDALFEDRTPEPPIPETALQVTRRLAVPPDVANKLAGGHPTFLMVRDVSNNVSLEKYQKVLAELTPCMSGAPQMITPTVAGLDSSGNIAPTVEIALFQTEGISAHQVEALVKKAVYTPGKGSHKDMFRLSAHGLII